MSKNKQSQQSYQLENKQINKCSFELLCKFKGKTISKFLIINFPYTALCKTIFFEENYHKTLVE